MSDVKFRHFVGAVLGALVSWGVILVFLVVYSVLGGSAPFSAFQGSHTLGPFTGTQGTVVLILLDFFIPLVAGFLFVGALAIVSRFSIAMLAFTSRRRALAEGAMLGLTVFFLFYIPVLYVLAHPTLAQAVPSLWMGLVDHLAFGSALVLTIFWIGGPVPIGDRSS